MDELEQIYNGIKNGCERIRAGSFIMSNDRITQLLRYLASHNEVVDFLSECNRLFDYKQEFIAATSYIGNSKVFKLPQNHYKIVVLVTGLLYEFDRQERDILYFLKEYFERGDVNKSFEVFCSEVIMPYAKAFEDLVYNKPISVDDVQKDETKSKQLSEAITEQLLPFMVDLSELIAEDNSLSATKRAELLDMLEGMCYAIEKGNANLLKYMWIGLKNTYAQYRIANSMLSGVKSVLVSFGIISQ